MPAQGIHYRAPQNIPDEALLGMVMTEPRPPRPNSIELRRSYPPEEHQLYSPPMSEHYRTANYVNQVRLEFAVFSFFVFIWYEVEAFLNLILVEGGLGEGFCLLVAV